MNITGNTAIKIVEFANELGVDLDIRNDVDIDILNNMASAYATGKQAIHTSNLFIASVLIVILVAVIVFLAIGMEKLDWDSEWCEVAIFFGVVGVVGGLIWWFVAFYNLSIVTFSPESVFYQELLERVA